MAVNNFSLAVRNEEIFGLLGPVKFFLIYNRTELEKPLSYQ